MNAETMNDLAALARVTRSAKYRRAIADAVNYIDETRAELANARARRAQTRADVLDMIDAAEDATADAHGAGAAEFDAAASIARRNLRGAYDARDLLGAGDLLRLALAVRSARQTFANYIDLPEELTR